MDKQYVYTDFWPNFDDGHNMHICNPRLFWPRFFESNFTKEDLANVDVIEISSVFGKTKPRPLLSEHGRTLRVSWSGESQCRDTNNYDINFIMRPSDFHQCVVCLTLLEYTMLDNPMLPLLARPDGPKSKFCVFVVTNGNCSTRNRFFELLNKYKKVDSCGKFQNNTGILAPCNNPEQNDYPLLPFLNEYKFMICFENTSLPMYLTEKLYYAWKAKTIPIYWGAQEITWLNPAAFLHLKDDMDSIVERVIYLDTHMQEYQQMLEEPLFLTSLPKWNLPELLRERPFPHIEHIFVICNRQHEPLHYRHLRTQFRRADIASRYVTYWSPTYGQLTEQQYSEFGISASKLTIGEASLCYNFLSLARQITHSWSSQGHFLVLEADACLLPMATHFLRDFVPLASESDVSGMCYNIGAGDTPMTPLTALTPSTPTWHPQHQVRCTEAIIWSYQALLNIQGEKVESALDWHVNTCLQNRKIVQLCSTPPYVEQGSKNGMFHSTLETDRLSKYSIEMDSEEEVELEVDVEDRAEMDVPPTEDSSLIISLFVVMAVFILIVMIVLLVTI